MGEESILNRAFREFDVIIGLQDEKEASSAPKQRPNPFVSTTWMLSEISEAQVKQSNIFAKLMGAKAAHDLADAVHYSAELRAVSFQILEMAKTAEAVFAQYQKQEASRAG